MTTVANDSFSV